MSRRAVVEALEANRGKLYAIARSMMGSEQDALDMVSEAACTAYRKAGALKSEASVDSWLCAIVVNCCRMALRRRRRWSDQEIDVDALSVPDQTAAVDAREMVERLPAAYRAIVLLRFFSDMRPPEIARRLGIPENTVRNRLSRALSLLRMQLEEE